MLSITTMDILGTRARDLTITNKNKVLFLLAGRPNSVMASHYSANQASLFIHWVSDLCNSQLVQQVPYVASYTDQHFFACLNCDFERTTWRNIRYTGRYKAQCKLPYIATRLAFIHTLIIELKGVSQLLKQSWQLYILKGFSKSYMYDIFFCCLLSFAFLCCVHGRYDTIESHTSQIFPLAISYPVTVCQCYQKVSIILSACKQFSAKQFTLWL